MLPRGAVGGRGSERGAGLGVGGEQVFTYRLEAGGETERERCLCRGRDDSRLRTRQKREWKGKDQPLRPGNIRPPPPK